MNIIVVGQGTAGKHYINILKSIKNINIFVIDTHYVKKSNYIKITNYKEIEKKK